MSAPKRNAPTKRDRALSALLASPTSRAMLALGLRAEVTPAHAVSPPGSLVDAVVSALARHTDLPPLLGVATVMSLISAAMVCGKTTVRWQDSPPSEMDLWLIALAGSGAGKTWIRNVVSDAVGITVPVFPEPASGPAYLDALQALGGRAYWPRDEYGQLLRAVADGGPRGDLRDLMLRTYDHDDLVHSTRTRGETRVERPVLTVLGTSVDSTWGDCIDAQMLADGLMARHLFVVAERRPLAVPRYPRDQIVAEIRAVAEGLAERLAEPVEYEITPEAAAVYDDLWRALVGDLAGSLDAAYVRRITWASAKYAVIYHVLLSKPGHRVGVTAMRWAWRMVQVHCYSARLVLSAADRSLSGRVERIAAWVTEQRDRGVDVRAPCFARKVIQQFKRDLGSVHEARQIVDLVVAEVPLRK